MIPPSLSLDSTSVKLKVIHPQKNGIQMDFIFIRHLLNAKNE